MSKQLFLELEKYVIRSFKICNFYPILFEWTYQEGWDEPNMERWEIPTKF